MVSLQLWSGLFSYIAMRKKTKQKNKPKFPANIPHTLIVKDSITIQVFNNGIYDKKAATQMLINLSICIDQAQFPCIITESSFGLRIRLRRGCHFWFVPKELVFFIRATSQPESDEKENSVRKRSFLKDNRRRKSEELVANMYEFLRSPSTFWRL